MCNATGDNYYEGPNKRAGSIIKSQKEIHPVHILFQAAWRIIVQCWHQNSDFTLPLSHERDNKNIAFSHIIIQIYN